VPEIEVYGYDVSCWQDSALVYESVDCYDELRKGLRHSSENIALGKFAWGDGSGAVYLTDGSTYTSWRHENLFGRQNWFGFAYSEPDGTMEGIEGVEIPLGSALYVDLNETVNISRIVIDPHVASAVYSYFGINASPVDYYVGISTDLEKWVWVARGTFHQGSSQVTHNIPAGLDGRFVRVEMVPRENSGFYEAQGIDEIEVYPYRPVEKGGGGNGKK